MIVCIMTFILLAVLLSGFKIAPEMLIIFYVWAEWEFSLLFSATIILKSRIRLWKQQ